MFGSLVIAVSLFFYTPPQGVELENGFYLTVDCAVRNNIKRKNELNEQKAVCLTQQPIVSIQEINSVSGLIDSGLMSYFDVFITPKALDQFKTIRASLKTTSIALVIDNKVLFLIGPEVSLEKVLRVTVFANSDIRKVQAKLAAEIAKRD
jgi:hypothetical protein